MKKKKNSIDLYELRANNRELQSFEFFEKKKKNTISFSRHTNIIIRRIRATRGWIFRWKSGYVNQNMEKTSGTDN